MTLALIGTFKAAVFAVMDWTFIISFRSKLAATVSQITRNGTESALHWKPTNTEPFRRFDQTRSAKNITTTLRGRILADDIWRNRQSGVVPNFALLEALRLHVRLFPQVYAKTGGGTGAQLLDARPILAVIEQAAGDVEAQEQEAARRAAELEQRLQAKAQQCLTTGNLIRRLPGNIQQLLQNNGRTSSSDASKSSGGRDMIPGTYVIHEEYDSDLGRSLTLTVRIEYVRSDTREQSSGQTKTITTTRYYNVILKWS